MTIKEAHRYCRRATRSEARNFYYGFVMLPRERRAAIYAAYAFSRRADDSVDGEDALEAKMAAIAARRSELNAVYGGWVPSDDPVLIALADAVDRFGIPRAALDDLLDGVEMDLTQTRYRDWPALERYCARVAGAVGVVSLHIFGFSSSAAPRYANELGIALQIVNIMRDVAEDSARDRIYLPLADLRDFGVAEGELVGGVTSPAFRALMASYGARAREYFAEGERLLPLLDRRSRMCVATLAELYKAILTEIEQRDYNVFHDRVSLSTPHKLAIMARSTFSSPSSSR